MKRLPLADLEAFAAVAEARSFRKAAILRGISPTSLSDALRRLEANLGLRLLTRTTRSVTLTDAGRRLLAGLSPALSDISQALEELKVSEGALTGTLRLNVPTIVARVILPPIITPFMKANPGLKIEVTAKGSFVDVFAEGFDAGVRYDERLELDMIAVPIGPRTQRFVVAASRSYFKTHGQPEHPEDLLKHICTRHRFQSGAVPAWEFERGGVSLRVDPPSCLMVNSIDMELHVARAGLAIIATFEEFLRADIATGKLHPILEDWSSPFSGPYLYYPSRKHMPSPLRAFIDFIKTKP